MISVSCYMTLQMMYRVERLTSCLPGGWLGPCLVLVAFSVPLRGMGAVSDKKI